MSASAVVGGLRRPLFLLALVAAALVVVVEVALPGLVLDAPPSIPPAEAAGELEVAGATVESDVPRPPGAGIGALALVDGLVLFSLLLVGASLLVPLRLYGRLQGVVTLVVSLLWVLLCLVFAVAAFATLLLMIGLFVSAPFGTLAYLAIWGRFATGDAATVLGLLLFLKICEGVLLVLAQPRFLLVKGLVALIAVSVFLQLALGFIHGFLPRPVVAIGDQAWAVITAVVGLVWAVLMLLLALPAIINAVRASGSIRD